ncbi:MAG: glycoside hydrolase family 92 protein [Bacteroidales bacterium]|nr:MAG: glycoside hydrolase family 92 protein [Bacteroidales bacterium]
MKQNIILTSAALLLLAFSCKSPEPFDLVDPMIGTGGHGHTFPGATLPFGMVQVSPSNDFKSWDWCSGYHYSDSIIKGFAHTHISGPGLAGLGDILLMPTSGTVQVKPGTEKNPEEGYRSRFSHKNEKAFPGYYSVLLDDYNINVELSCSERVGFHKYTFNSGGSSNIIIDPTHNIIESVFDTQVELLSDSTVRGYKTSNGEAGKRTVYFVANFSKPFTSYGIANNDTIAENGKKATGKNSKAYISYNLKKGESIEVKVALSFVGYEGAMANLEKEASGRNFNSTLNEAKNKWKDKLNRIRVEGGSVDQRKTFYTALYHSFISPNLISDVDGCYVVEGKKFHSEVPQFSNYSTWDTYRALHPLFTIIDQKKTSEFVNSLVSRFTDSKVELPSWELLGHDNICMIGYPTVSLIADAVLKDISGVNPEEAFQAIKAAANDLTKNSPNYDVSGMEDYISTGFVSGDINCSVSKTTEYNYYDWCISCVAKKLNDSTESEYYLKRSIGYRYLYNPEYEYLFPRLYTGNWRKMDVSSWNDLKSNYISGNIWGYTSYVPHDVNGLISLIGGNEKFNVWLDKIFSDTSNITGDAHVDISGFIGKYGHGDEPSHHLPYLYSYSGQPWKTQYLVHKIMNDFYSAKVDGLINNEDLGQMSAWYILSSLGFYSVCPGDLTYIIGSPVYPKAQINLENGKSFTIIAKNISSDNIYIQSALLNGKEYTKSYITHQNIMDGGELTLIMGSKPNMQWGAGVNDLPISKVVEPQNQSSSSLGFVLMPFDTNPALVFEDSRKVDLKCNTEGAEIRFTLDGTEPNVNSTLYRNPLTINRSMTLRAKAWHKGLSPSKVFKQDYYNGFTYAENGIVPKYYLKSKLSQFGKEDGRILFDKLCGKSFFGDGNWNGFNGIDCDITIEFPCETSINQIVIGYLTSTHNWIFPPKSISVYLSDDNTNFNLANKLMVNPMNSPEANAFVTRPIINLNGKKGKYLKIMIENNGPIPDWHRAAGNKPWLLIDEIIIS